jgi:hypothetical protein
VRFLSPTSTPLAVASLAQVLDNSPYKWLHEMLEVLNTGGLLTAVLNPGLVSFSTCMHWRPPFRMLSCRGAECSQSFVFVVCWLSALPGDLHAYDALCAKYASVLNGQPALVEHERRLREKVRGLAAASVCRLHLWYLRASALVCIVAKNHHPCCSSRARTECVSGL